MPRDESGRDNVFQTHETSSDRRVVSPPLAAMNRMNAYPARDKKFVRQASFLARGSWNAQPACADGDRQLIGSGDWPCSGCPFPLRHYQG
jgi:hypothetical protein